MGNLAIVTPSDTGEVKNTWRIDFGDANNFGSIFKGKDYSVIIQHEDGTA